ncbi:hypothetical protein MRQ36_12945 [Micromonospora sp. R77]|uniref:hypothetical protein n=1 Tax=Micromonospora sp. R77 TaxID=2925836 RepID=UPI001F60B4A5|nr:hypothetical protein [Micromonospora sp. R77]MCI4063434.1 hypothetical protein [Micromonospora sp. R77]
MLRARWPDRRRDLAGWLLTPLVTLVAAPVTAGAVGVLILLGGGFSQSPTFCESVVSDNRCEEKTLAMLGEHAVLFGAVWLLLWLVPWWRGLRTPRVLLAVVATLVLVAAPLRMMR